MKKKGDGRWILLFVKTDLLYRILILSNFVIGGLRYDESCFLVEILKQEYVATNI